MGFFTEGLRLVTRWVLLALTLPELAALLTTDN